MSIFTDLDVLYESKTDLTDSELRKCVKVEVAVLGSPIPNSPYDLCGHKATLNLNLTDVLCVNLHVLDSVCMSAAQTDHSAS